MELKINDNEIKSSKDLEALPLNKRDIKKLKSIFSNLYKEDVNNLRVLNFMGLEIISEFLESHNAFLLQTFKDIEHFDNRGTLNQAIKLRVFDPALKETVELTFKADEILGVFSEDDSKKKSIYRITGENQISIKKYIYNSNKNFSNLVLELDPLSRRLVYVEKGTIVNIKYYTQIDNDSTTLKLDAQFKMVSIPKTVKISKPVDKGSYNQVRKIYENSIYLPERAFSYLKKCNEYLNS
jgi:hypothetical protein